MYVCSVYIHLFRTHEFNRRPVSEMSHIQILFGKFNFYFWLFTFNISERQWYLYYYSSAYQYIHEIYKLLKKVLKKDTRFWLQRRGDCLLFLFFR